MSESEFHNSEFLDAWDDLEPRLRDPGFDPERYFAEKSTILSAETIKELRIASRLSGLHELEAEYEAWIAEENIRDQRKMSLQTIVFRSGWALARRFPWLTEQRFAVAAAALVILTLFVSPMFLVAQPTKVLSGVVTGIGFHGDLSGLKILITSVKTGDTYTVETESEGVFRYEGLLTEGRYIVEVDDDKVLPALSQVVYLSSNGDMEVLGDFENDELHADAIKPRKDLVLHVIERNQGLFRENTGGIAGYIILEPLDRSPNLLFARIKPAVEGGVQKSAYVAVSIDGFYLIDNVPQAIYELQIFTRGSLDPKTDVYPINVRESREVDVKSGRITLRNIRVSAVEHPSAPFYDRIDDYAIAGVTRPAFEDPDFEILWNFTTDNIITVSQWFFEYGNNKGILPYDFDEDGVKEVFVGEGVDEFYLDPAKDDPNNYGNVYLVDQDGSLIWRFATGSRSEYVIKSNFMDDSGEISIVETPVDTRYSVEYLAPVEASELPGKELFVCSNHEYAASRFILLSHDGISLNDFFHWGHPSEFAFVDENGRPEVDRTLGQPLSENERRGWLIADIDSDGKDELIAAANWAKQEVGEVIEYAVIFCLDLDQMSGYAPQGEGLPSHTGLKWYKLVEASRQYSFPVPNEGWLVSRDDGGYDVRIRRTNGREVWWDVTINAITGDGEGVIDP